ncbi:DUF397 domain-containing protein [Catellatospora sichuanensis]|uniref:DUF397 domain-containing protein n=1 Tax=Catellatospora sichuanensis TaxID=1969805 RepID=UPI001182BF89|nr:DUF397 domain-containing protein [Catellatospora sichuanensis]
MASSDFDQAEWRKSSRSDNNGGQCVEVALTTTTIGVRDSKDRDGTVLTFAAEGWAAFLTGVKSGEFDR